VGGGANTSNSSALPGIEWISRFERERGRRLRVLHLGNIANNAYLNSKIQRRFGIDADAVAFDYYHVMGNPEWEDAAFSGEVDEFFPDWWAVGLGAWERPRWFVQGSQQTCIAYLAAQHAGDRRRSDRLWRRLRLERWLLTRSTAWATTMRIVFLGVRATYAPRRARSTAIQFAATGRLGVSRGVIRLIREADFYARLVYRKLRGLVYAAKAVAGGTPPHRALAAHVFPTRLKRFANEPGGSAQEAAARAALESAGGAAGDSEAWVARFHELFPDRPDQLAAEDALPWHQLGSMWRDVMSGYDVVQVYATYPAIALAAGIERWTAYEHGTLRDIPFADDPVGRITAFGYREAPAVFVTNADDLLAAERLGIAADRVVALPHAVDTVKLFAFAEAHGGLTAEAAGTPRFFAPARQDWVDGFRTQLKGNDRIIRALRILLDRGNHPRVVLVDWGRHAEDTKRLIEELGVGESVDWIAPLRKEDLWRAYIGSHAVLDQFVMDVIGGVTFEAMALGRRVITALDEAVNIRFFGEAPPVLAAQSPEEIADAMQAVIDDLADGAGLGAKARDWIERYHSSERIVRLQAEVYERLVTSASPS
jgi:glycosyltransferase involved in cell wall biosynthesis